MSKINKTITSLIIVMMIVFLTSCKNNFNQCETDSSVKNDIVLNDDSVDNDLLKNSAQKTTSKDNEYYTSINAGNYLGIDFPKISGTYFKELHSYEEFSTNVENYNLIEENIFDDNFILIVRRVSCSPSSDIGYKNYDSISKSIELFAYPTFQTDAIEETKTDFLIIPRGIMSSVDASQESMGKLTISIRKNNYLEMFCFPSFEKESAVYFDNVISANKFLQNNGCEELPINRFDNEGILILCLNVSLESYKSNIMSCYLGFKDFNTNGTDIYITLERNIVNGDYGNDIKGEAFCIGIPNDLIINNIVENPNIHILVKDNIIEVIGNNY